MLGFQILGTAEVWVHLTLRPGIGHGTCSNAARRLVAGVEIPFLCYHKQFKWHPDYQGFKSMLGEVSGGGGRGGDAYEMAQHVKALPVQA